jgi:Fe-S-cluster containining protein
MTTALPIVGQPVAATTPTPTVEALATLTTLAQRRLMRPTGWWTWVRLQRRFSLRMLQPHQLRVRMPTPMMRPDCDGCTDICCTGDHAWVSLRLADLARLKDIGRLDDKALSFARPPTRSDATWARKEADGSVFHHAFPHLARDDTGTCVFLTDERMCGLWPHWPLSCARYPYALDLPLRVVFYAAGCKSHAEPTTDAPPAVRALVRAVCSAYNERVLDVLRLAACGDELRALGLLDHIREKELPFVVRSLPGS